MSAVLAFIVLCLVKLLSKIFYRTEANWIDPPADRWKDIRLIVILNHTSLYEPLFASQAPLKLLWRFASKLAAPGAKKTLDRPLVGRLWKVMIPRMTPITRKRDDTWVEFMESIEDDSLIVIAPEGRMKRPDGFDAEGNPMSIRSGIGDILFRLDQGEMLIVYSGGLHHVQSPGQMIPRIFKTIKVNFEKINIAHYNQSMPKEIIAYKRAVINDLTLRLKKNQPN